MAFDFSSLLTLIVGATLAQTNERYAVFGVISLKQKIRLKSPIKIACRDLTVRSSAGEDHALLAKRVAIYKAAKEQHPARWSGEIRNWQRINIVHLNPEKNIIDKEQPAELKNAA